VIVGYRSGGRIVAVPVWSASQTVGVGVSVGVSVGASVGVSVIAMAGSWYPSPFRLGGVTARRRVSLERVGVGDR
jgi:hypothetical protein